MTELRTRESAVSRVLRADGLAVAAEMPHASLVARRVVRLRRMTGSAPRRASA